VYENVTGVTVGSRSKRVEGSQVGDYWKMADGTLDEIVEVGLVPRHKAVLSNDYVRVLRSRFLPMIRFWRIVTPRTVCTSFSSNHIQGRDPQCADCMGFGEV
jgi:hypothetical protein